MLAYFHSVAGANHPNAQILPITVSARVELAWLQTTLGADLTGSGPVNHYKETGSDA